MRKMTLGSKLLLGGICLVLIPLASVASFVLVRSAAVVEDASGKEVLRITDGLAGIVDRLYPANSER